MTDENGVRARLDVYPRAALAPELVSATLASWIGATRSINVLLAVDTSRLAAVSSWQGSSTGLSSAQLAHRLAPRGGPSLRLRGTRLRLSLDDLQLDDASGDPIALRAVVADAHRWHVVDLGSLDRGAADSRSGVLPCSTGCRRSTL